MTIQTGCEDPRDYEEKGQRQGEEEALRERADRFQEMEMSVSKLYDDVVDLWRRGISTNGKEVKEEVTMAALLESGIPVLVEFAKDDDLQYIQVCSTNVGMVRTYQKRFAKGGNDGR